MKAQVTIKTIASVAGGIISIELGPKTLKSKIYLGEEHRIRLQKQFNEVCEQINKITEMKAS